MYEIKTLKNGIRCAAKKVAERDSLSIGVWLNAGGRYESKEKNGVSHFLEHLLFKGTKKRSTEKIKEEIEGRGGAMNGFTSEEFTCYLVKVLEKDIEIAVDVLSDMIRNPRLSDEDIEKERMVIIEEIKMYKDLPSHHVHDILTEILWPEQPLGMNLAGSIETVSSLTRKDIGDYKEGCYNTENMTVAACGNMDTSGLLECCERYFNDATPGRKSVFEEARAKQDKAKIKLLSKPTEQTHLAMGLRSFGRSDPDRYALAILNIILGGNMSSRLFRELRENRGLAYEISAHVKKLYDTGVFIISAGLDNSKVSEAVGLICDELRKIKTRPIEKDELQRAKQFYKGQLLLGLEDTAEHMLWMGEQMSAENRIIAPEEILKKIDAVTSEDIMKVAARIFDDSRLNLALIGPLSQKDQDDVSQALNIER